MTFSIRLSPTNVELALGCPNAPFRTSQYPWVFQIKQLRTLDIALLFRHIPARLLTKLKAAGSGPGKRHATHAMVKIDAAAAGA